MIGTAIAGFAFPFYSNLRREKAIKNWATRLLRILKINVEVRGNTSVLKSKQYIVAANHISWLDVFLIHAIQPVRFVAKSEIRSWPIAGWLSAKAGTLFIERTKRHHTATINVLMRDALTNGEPIGLFPEGTTSRGDEIKKLHSSLFQAAVETEVSILPICIRYFDEREKRSEAAAYVGDISFLASAIEIVSANKINAVVEIGDSIVTLNKNRRELANETYEALNRMLHKSSFVS